MKFDEPYTYIIYWVTQSLSEPWDPGTPLSFAKNRLAGIRDD